MRRQRRGLPTTSSISSSESRSTSEFLDFVAALTSDIPSSDDRSWEATRDAGEYLVKRINDAFEDSPKVTRSSCGHFLCLVLNDVSASLNVGARVSDAFETAFRAHVDSVSGAIVFGAARSALLKAVEPLATACDGYSLMFAVAAEMVCPDPSGCPMRRDGGSEFDKRLDSWADDSFREMFRDEISASAADMWG
jgi:hypothetical protein